MIYLEKKLINFLVYVLFIFSFNVHAEELKDTKIEDKGVDFSLQDVPFKQAVNLIYSDVLNRSFMVDPIILERNEKITFKMINEKNPHAFFKRYFENFNIQIFTKNGVDYLKYVEPKEVKPKVNIKFESFVYTPKFRGVTYLSDNLKSLIENQQFKETNKKASVNTKGDKLIIYSDKETVKMVKSVLPQIDTKPQQIIVTARIIEVKKDKNNQSGLSVLLGMLNNKLNVNLDLGVTSNNFLNLKLSNVNAVFSMIDSDAGFNVISSPVLRVLDGEKGVFTVGSDVPTIQGETVNNYGTTKNISYVSAGVIFDVEPLITDNGIKLKVKSELSDFTKTENGVNDTPTLLKRLVDSTVFVEDRGLVILGGLSQEKNTEVKDSFFFLPASIFGSSKKFEKSDVLLLLYVEKSNDYNNLIDLDEQIKKEHLKTFKDLKKVAR